MKCCVIYLKIYFDKLDYEIIFLFGLDIKSDRVNVNFMNLILNCARYAIYKCRNNKVYSGRTIDIQMYFKTPYKDICSSVESIL